MELIVGFMFLIVVCFIIDLDDKKTVKERTRKHIRKQRATHEAIKKSKHNYKSDFKKEAKEENS